jgi:hypothetical protein
MAIKFKTDKRMESNLADNKVDLRKNWYAVGTDGKKSYITTIKNAMSIHARNEAKSWAKKNGLTLEVVRSNN